MIIITHRLSRNLLFIRSSFSTRRYLKSRMESPYFKTEVPGEIPCASSTAILATKRQTRSLSKKIIDVKGVQVNHSPSKMNKKQRTKVKKSIVALAAETLEGPAIKSEETAPDEKWMPENWERVLDNIREMRKNRDAPVDNMGCEQCPDKSCPPEVRRFQILVSLMLSSQTRDQMTHAATEKLKEHGLTIQNILHTEEEVIAKLIYPVGFWRRKANYLKRTAAILAEQYNYDIPNTVKELCKLPGVGQKMAVLCVNIAWENVVGIGVDTHVHRISNRLGWTKKLTKTPHDTEKDLEDWIPRHLWEEVNVLLVGFGQQKCTPLRPQCGSCLNRYLCPTGRTWVPSPVKGKKDVKREATGSPEIIIKIEP